MPIPFFLLCLVTAIPLLSVHAGPAPRGFLLNCGSTDVVEVNSQKWVPDEGFINVGNKTTIKNPDLVPTLATLRFFPDASARKYCYVIPVIKGRKYLIRTTYYYGGFDGGEEPPVFDQIVDGTKWSTVNTTEDYAKGLSSYYEIIMAARGKSLSICIARNERTASSPFISSLELNYLEASMYNSTDFDLYGLGTVARHSFGDVGMMFSFPDDQYNRFWQPVNTTYSNVASHVNVSTMGLWNVPPVKAFRTGITTSRGKPIEIQWPAVSLPSSYYYIALYFQDNRTPSPYCWRVFNVSINGKNFYTRLNVTVEGVAVYATKWPLTGLTEIKLTPEAGDPVGPVLNAGEILQIVPFGGWTVTRDVMAMGDLARSFNNPPSDWRGDPCLPLENSWTGVTCSGGKFYRVITLNLTNVGLSGSLSPSLGNLTALSHIWLGGNKISGHIPDLKNLKDLKSLHLENNQLEGSIPPSLGQIPNLQEIFIQNNKLDSQIPRPLQSKKGVHIRVTDEEKLDRKS